MAVSPPAPLERPNPTAWLDSFVKQVGSYDPVTQTTTNTSPAASADIERLLAVLTGRVTADTYSKEAAFKDSDAAIAQIFNDFKQTALPQIFQASRGTGGYNSSTAQLLANDAFARAVAQGQATKLQAAKDYGQISAQNANAAANAGQVAKGMNPRTVQQAKPSTMSTVMQGAGLAARAAPYLFGRKGLLRSLDPNVAANEAGAVALLGSMNPAQVGAFGSSPDFGGTAGTGLIGQNSVFSDFTPTPAVDFNSMIFDQALGSGAEAAESLFSAANIGDFGAETAFNFGDSFGQSIEQAASLGGEAISGASDFLGFSDLGVAEFASDAVGGVAEGIGGIAGSGVPIIGPAINLIQGDVGGAVGTAVGGAIGNAIFPGVGGVIGGFIGDTIGGGSVICTELLRQGKMPLSLYLKDIEYAQKNLSPIMLRGYRYWAVPFVKQMRKSEFLSNCAKWFAVNRAESLVQRNGTGNIIRFIFEPICYLIGLAVTEVNWKEQLYGTN